MVAKVMCLSIAWYHAGLMPGWEGHLATLEKRVTRFIWKGTLSKVAKQTLLMKKEEGGLRVWALQAKAEAFRNTWPLKFILGKLNPLLQGTIAAISELYRQRAEEDIPLW